jgi:hypothetical protein
MGRLGSPPALHNYQGNPVVGMKNSPVLALDPAIMNKDFAFVGHSNKSPALLLIKALYLTFKHVFTY